MLVADGGGGGGAMYAVQIESLEEFQQKLTTILQDLEANNNVMSLGDGASTYGKIAAARALGLEVIMPRRPPAPDVPSVGSLEDVLAFVDHAVPPLAARGV